MQKLASVLLVDDDQTTNFLNEALLNSLGVTDKLLTVESGPEALATLEQASSSDGPALVLLDVNMPGMSGIQFLEAYQQLPQAQQQATVVIMLATTMDASDLARMNDLPIAGLVSKPLTREKVDAILQLHFQRQLPSHE